MEDSKPILDSGSATPYLAIFGVDSKPLIDPMSKKPLGLYVVSFEYQYKEDGGDSFSITIECDNPNIIDMPELGNQMTLLLQWGWIYPNGKSNSGPVRKVVIRDTEEEFNDNSVRFIIKGTDAFSLTKVMPANLEDKTFLAWLKNNISGKFYIDIVDYNKKVSIYTESKN